MTVQVRWVQGPERGITAKQVAPNTRLNAVLGRLWVQHEANRDGEYFHYQKCGYEVNAAKSIGLRYAQKRQRRLRFSPKSGDGDAPVDVPVNGGRLNGKSHQPIIGTDYRESTSKPTLNERTPYGVSEVE